jgi:flagellar protein FliJ
MERSFRLAGLLRLRTLQEDQAAGVLAVSHGALRVAEGRRAATLTTLAGHAMPAAADASTWRTSVTARGALTHLLADAAIEVRDAGERVTADTALWSAARSRSVGLEKLQDKHRALLHAEDERAEQLALDEVAARSGRTSTAGPTASGHLATRRPRRASAPARTPVGTTARTPDCTPDRTPDRTTEGSRA